MTGWAWRGVVVQMGIIVVLAVALCLAFVMRADAVRDLILILGMIASHAFAKAKSSAASDPNDPSSGTGVSQSIRPTRGTKFPPDNIGARGALAMVVAAFLVLFTLGFK